MPEPLEMNVEGNVFPPGVEPEVTLAAAAAIASELLLPQMAVDAATELPWISPWATELTGDVPTMSTKDMRRVRANFIEAVGMEEQYPDARLTHDFIGLERHMPDGTIQTYDQKRAASNPEAKGPASAASFGLGKIGEHETMFFVMDFDHVAGAVGVVEGAKYERAIDQARELGVPFVAYLSSGGMSQWENYAALLQMPRMLHAQKQFKDATGCPLITVGAGHVWGGTSASIGPMGDILVALPGGMNAFSGRGPIERFQQGSTSLQPRFTPEVQRVENGLAHRTIDAIVSEEQLLPYLQRILDVTRSSRRKLSQSQLAEGIVTVDVTPPIEVDRSKSGVLPVELGGSVLQVIEEPAQPVAGLPVSAEELNKRYQDSIASPDLLTAEDFMRGTLTEFVPFYNRFVAGGELKYPAIIAGIGRIGGQPFLAVGSQPSYRYIPEFNRFVRHTANPGPRDFAYLERVLDAGERWKLPAVFFGDTLGALPTEEAEAHNQMRAIASAILHATSSYEQPVISVLIRMLGSGGGLTVTPNSDAFCMLDTALACVAEPASADTILHGDRATHETLLHTLSTMGATAQKQLELGLIDDIIPETGSREQIILAVRQAIMRAYINVQDLSPVALARRRDKRIRHQGANLVDFGPQYR